MPGMPFPSSEIPVTERFLFFRPAIHQYYEHVLFFCVGGWVRPGLGGYLDPAIPRFRYHWSLSAIQSLESVILEFWQLRNLKSL